MKDFLQGKVFKHPLHPLLVHFPLALFPLSLVLDLCSLAVPGNALIRGAFFSMVLGVITALFAAVPGFVDYNAIRQDHPARRIATFHLVLNVVLVGLYAVNLGFRYPDLNAIKTPLVPLWTSVAGVALLGVSGYLGGAMVYDHGIAVGRHRRLTETPDRTVVISRKETGARFVPVADEQALRDGETLRVELNGQVLCLAKTEGRVYAFQEFCTHRYGPLSEGALCQNHIECPWHRSVFDVRTGQVVQGPARTPLNTYRVEVRDGLIHVAVGASEATPPEQEGLAA